MTGRSPGVTLLFLLALTVGCGQKSKTGVPTAADPATVAPEGDQVAVDNPNRTAPAADQDQGLDGQGLSDQGLDDQDLNDTGLNDTGLNDTGLDVGKKKDVAGSPAKSATEPAADSARPAAVASADPSGPQIKPAPRKLFEGWGTPRVVLLVTGQQHGYIEPCGCTQLANQKGGLARRHTLVKQLAAKGWPLVGLDAGNQVRRFGRQAEIKFHMTLEGLKTIGYEGIVLGSDDLRLSVDELIAASVPPEGQTTPFVCANAAVLDWSLMPDHKVIEKGGLKIGVTAIVGQQWQKEVARDDVVFKDPAAGLRVTIPKLDAAGCDVLVLLSHASVAESKKLASEFPQFDVVVAAGAAGDATDPLYRPEAVEGSKAMFVQTGIKGMFAGAIGVFDDRQQPLRYQRIPLDVTYEDSPEMLKLLKSYQNQLETVGLSGLSLRPVSHPSGNQFLGSEKCGECHTKAFDVWQNTPHAKATDSLVNPVERADIPRHFDPECLSCHVTGWHPQRFFPYSSGFLSLSKSVAMHGNGCENCHGPGSAHVAAEEGTTDVSEEMQTALRLSMRVTKAASEKKCIECHDIDNSPNFYDTGAFDRYFQDIEHIGKD